MISSRRKSVGLVAVLLAFTLTAAACGSDSKSGGTTDTKKVGTKDSAKPKPGGTMTMALESENSGGWCLPSAQLAAAGIQVANAIYDPLVILDANYEWKPYLAQTVTPNADATEWTFKLRSGITFSDGTPLNADIVKENIDLTYGEPTIVAKTGISPLLFRFVYSNIASVEKVDDLTVTVKMKSAWSAFPYYLAGSRNGIIGQAQIDAGKVGCADKLVGTGPFMLESWTRNQQFVAVKNPKYWRKDANGVQLPYLDKIIFKPIESSTNRLSALEGGTVDAMHTTNANNRDQIKKESDKFTLIPEADGRHEVSYGLLNVAKGPFADITVRKALAMALDRNALNDVGNNGEFKIANQPFDTKVMGYVKDLAAPKYDPDAAAKVLKPMNLTVRLSYATDPSTKLIAEDVKRQLGDVGVAVNIDEKDQSTLINQALGGDFDLLLWRNHPGVDPDTQLVWWHSGSLVNFGKINDLDLDKLLDEGRAETDPAKRTEIYQNVSKLFADKLYDAWNWYSEWAFGTNKKVHNLGYNTLPDGSPGTGLNWGWTYLPEVWVDH